MAVTAPERRSCGGARQVGYTVGAVVDLLLLYFVNVEPGWQAVPVLTGDTVQVLALVNLSLAAGFVVNLVYAAYDPSWWKNLGDLLTSGITLALLVRVWVSFPFAFPAKRCLVTRCRRCR